ncbi:MAG: hypothetical protein QOG43_2107 [Actinomycetota bacterium]|jgi:hypothetical protein|nr:hypothetical protein [Actinomycetota bacterium]
MGVFFVTVIAIVAGVILLRPEAGPRSPEVLNQSTEVGQIQELAPGVQPGDPPFVLEREDH